MKTVGIIIHNRRQSLGLTLAQLAKAVGVTKAYLSMIENQRVANPPSRHFLDALEQALGITDGQLVAAANWHNTPLPVRAELQQLVDQSNRTHAFAQWLKSTTSRRKNGAKNLDQLFRTGELSRRLRTILKNDAPLNPTAVSGIARSKPHCYRVPLINNVAAGYPTDFSDLDYPARIADEYVDCPDLTDPQAFAARVVGSSMLPEYREGDVIVFSPDADITDGCDCFVRLEPNHETTFKRVFFDDKGMIRLQPLNPKFPPQTLHRQAVAGMYRAVWRFQKLDQ